jgi:hypothetical protein
MGTMAQLSIVANTGKWCRLRAFLLRQMPAGHASASALVSSSVSTLRVPCGNAMVLLPVVLRMLF